MTRLDESGLMLLVEPVALQTTASALRTMRKESVLSICNAARRAGSITVVVGSGNTRIDCRYVAGSEFQWTLNGQPVAAHQVSRALDRIQQRTA